MGKEPRKKRRIAFEADELIPAQEPETPQPVDANGDEVAVGDILARKGLPTIPKYRLVGIHPSDRKDRNKELIVHMVLQPLVRPPGSPEQPTASRTTVPLTDLRERFVIFKDDDWSEDWDHEIPPRPTRPE